MNFIKDSLKLSNKSLGVPFFQLINMGVDLKNKRIIKYGYKRRINHLGNDDIGHIIAYIKLCSKQEHKDIAYKSEYKIRYGNNGDRDCYILGKKYHMELAYQEGQIHIDHGKKAYVGSEKDVHQKAAEESHPDALLVTFDKGCGAGKNKKNVRHNSAKINYPKDSGLQDE